MSQHTRSTAVAALLLAGSALVGCTSGPTAPTATGPTASRPSATDPSAGSPAGSPTGSAATCPNPAASFDPLPTLPPPGRMPAGSTMAAIVARGRLVVATAGDKPLVAARDPRTGDLRGLDIDLSREVARAIFGNPDAVEFRTVSYAAREPLLTSRQVDMVAHTMTMTCDRWTRVIFSAEYFRDGQRLLVRSDSPAKEVEDLAGQRVCVARGTTTIDNLRAFPSVRVVPVDDAADCLVLFQRGEVDAITSNEVILRGYTAQDPYAKIIGRNLSDEPRGLAFGKGEVDLARFVNAVLARLRTTGVLAGIVHTYLPTVDPATVLHTPTYGRPA